jgi:hypothetical protein
MTEYQLGGNEIDAFEMGRDIVEEYITDYLGAIEIRVTFVYPEKRITTVLPNDPEGDGAGEVRYEVSY